MTNLNWTELIVTLILTVPGIIGLIKQLRSEARRKAQEDAMVKKTLAEVDKTNAEVKEVIAKASRALVESLMLEIGRYKEKEKEWEEKNKNCMEEIRSLSCRVDALEKENEAYRELFKGVV